MSRIARGTEPPATRPVADIARDLGLDPQRARRELRKFNLGGGRVEEGSATERIIHTILVETLGGPEEEPST
jgi:hypothetical protein